MICLRKDILAFCGDLDVNFVVTVFDPNTNQIMYKVTDFVNTFHFIFLSLVV